MKNPDNHIAHALGERSGQYIVSSKKPALIILPSTEKEKATKALNALRGGANYEVEDLDVLDEILRNMTSEDRERFLAWSGSRAWDWAMLERIRFERGIDPRPKA